ncbi:MAG TPA: DUF2795 domain-containing protein [Streptosporangiaceae bacterium]
MADQPSFIEVQRALSGMNDPASRKQLVEHAKSPGASQPIIRALTKIPDRDYEGPSGVSKEVANVS